MEIRVGSVYRSPVRRLYVKVMDVSEGLSSVLCEVINPEFKMHPFEKAYDLKFFRERAELVPGYDTPLWRTLNGD